VILLKSGLARIELSNNNFTASRIEMIAERQNKNHVVMDIHVINEITTYELRFIAPF
jgi:hypothetical protein